jgi:hypothetical protein
VSPIDPTRPTSTRIMLARLAEAVVADDPGVRAAPAEEWRTRDGDREIPGVVATAGADGRVDVDLHLLAYMPPRPIERQVTSICEALREAARRTGTEGRIGRIEITIEDVIAPIELGRFRQPDDRAFGGDAG